jgi:parallel beta-helix repeat protein
VVRVNHGAGITTAGHVEVTGNRVLRNGQLGIGGTGAETYVTDNEVAFNNTAGFDPGWEAGGAKWAVTDGLVVLRNRVHDNDGPGLWTDIDARGTTYIDNVVRDNTRAGIFHEISADATIRGNTVTGNGHGFDTWLWGAGILLAGSHDVEVDGNTLSGNAAGIALIQQDRGDSDVDGMPHTLHDLSIHDNEVTMSRGPSGGVTDDGYDAMFDDPTITWTGNTWLGSAGRPFWWADDELTLAQWRDLGHD